VNSLQFRNSLYVFRIQVRKSAADTSAHDKISPKTEWSGPVVVAVYATETERKYRVVSGISAGCCTT